MGIGASWTGPAARLSLAVLAAAIASACSTTPVQEPRSGAVGYSEVSEDAASDRIVLGDNETYLPPLPLPGNALPDYPEAMLADALPVQVVCVQASITTEGTVGGTRPVSDLDGCPPPAQAFYDAAAAAVATWRYNPGFRCIYERAEDRDPRGCVGDAREEPLAVRLNYRFEFGQTAGQGRVTMTGG